MSEHGRCFTSAARSSGRPALGVAALLSLLAGWLLAPAFAQAQATSTPDSPQALLLRIGATKLRETADVRDVAFSKDGRRVIATAGTFVRTWDAATGDEQRSFRIAWSHRVRLSGDGSLLAYSPFNRSAEVIDTATGAILGKFEGNAQGEGNGQGLAEQMAFSADNRLLAVVFRSEVRVWNIREKKLIQRWQFPDTPPASGGCPCFSPDGARLACAADGAGIYLWDIASGNRLHFMHQGENQANHYCGIAFSPNGRILATFNRSGCYIDLWDADAGKHVLQLGPKHSFQFACHFLPDDKTLVAADRASSAGLWDVGTGESRSALAIDGAPVTCLALSPDGKRLAAGAADHAIRLFSLDAMKEITPGRHALAGPASARLLADGRTLLTWDTWNHGYRSPATPLFRHWDLHGKLLKSIPQQATPNFPGYWSFEPSPTGEHVAVIKHDALNRLYLRDLASNRDREIWSAGDWNIHRVAFGRGGDMLLAQLHAPPSAGFSLERPIKVLRRAGEVWREVAVVPSWDFVLSADGSQFVSYHFANKEVRYLIWDRETGQRRIPFTSKGIGTPLALSSCARRVVIAGTEHEALLVDSASGTVVTRLGKHESEPRVAFSPRGDLLAAGAPDGTILLYDGVSGDELARFRGHRGAFASLHFSADGKRLISGNYDTTVALWDMAPWELRARLKPTAFSSAELDKSWHNLGGDGSAAWRAVAGLIRSEDQAVSLLRRRLHPARKEDFAQAEPWIVQLDDPRFEKRQEASIALERLADKAVPPLRRALVASTSTLEASRRIELILAKIESLPPSPESLRRQRALAVLELIDDPSAGSVLGELSRGVPEAELTRQAKAALSRMQTHR